MSDYFDHLPLDDNDAWVTYIDPLLIVRKDDQPEFGLPIDDVNACTYDHSRLCDVVTGIPLDESDSLRSLVCFDGAIAIPRLGRFLSVDAALTQFNTIFCSLLIGGVRCEAVDRRDIVWGQLSHAAGIWPVNPGRSINSNLHYRLRMRTANNYDTILLFQPKNITVSTFVKAYQEGASVLNTLNGVSPTFLLRGFTELRYHNFSDALANLWITVEQLTAFLWSRHLESDRANDILRLKGRHNSLKGDSRTWSTTVRHEILYQVGLIGSDIYSMLFPARKARNNLVHTGTEPDPSIVVELYEGVVLLIESLSDVESLGIRTIDIKVPDEKIQPSSGSFSDWKDLSRRLYRR